MAMEYEKKLGGDVLADTLIDLVKEGLDIVTIENDLRFTFTNRFGQAYPDRFIDAGIAEANSIGIASGMSEAGMIPVVHSLTPFITRRCYDQIVISIQYSGLHVKLIGTDPGIYSELNGGTHLSVEDVAIMRAIPNMLVIDAIDNTALENLTRLAMRDERSAYIRVARKFPRKVYGPDAKFELGKANTVREGSDMTIIASGLISHVVVMGETSRQIRQQLEEAGYDRISQAYSMSDAIEKSRLLAVSGGNVLLSPACASFDMFKDFEQRGEIFKELVNQLQ